MLIFVLFVRLFVLRLFGLPLGVREGLRLVTMSLPAFSLTVFGYGKNIRYLSGNSHIVGIDKVMMPSIELLKCCHQFSYFVSLNEQLRSEHSSSFIKVMILRR